MKNFLKTGILLLLFPLGLSGQNRPQTPQPPFPYRNQEIRVFNPVANIHLDATLSLPDTSDRPGVRYPAIILVSGSGPQNRDEEIFHHKPFAVLADTLCRNGFAVIRYDDRGYGKSEGNFQNSTTLDFLTDAQAVIRYLVSREDIDPQKIGILGHSEGGLIATILGAEDPQVRFLILMGAPALPGKEIILLQQKRIAAHYYKDPLLVESSHKVQSDLLNLVVEYASQPMWLDYKLRNYIKNEPLLMMSMQGQPMDTATYISQVIAAITNPWYIQFLTLNPQDYIPKVEIPTLALYGEKDQQVPAPENTKVLHEISPRSWTIRTFPSLNHLFQPCGTGMPDEYVKIEQTIAPQVLQNIVLWLKTVL